MLGMRIDLLLRVGLVGDVGVVGITVIIAVITHMRVTFYFLLHLPVKLTMMNCKTD